MSTAPLIERFAEQYRLKVRRDSCGDEIIPGKPHKADRPEDRNHIYEHSDGRLGVYLSFPSARSWNARRTTALAAGFVLNQNAQTEGTLLFSPENEQQARLAIRLAGIKRIRKSTPEQLARLAEFSFKPRPPAVEGPLAT